MSARRSSASAPREPVPMRALALAVVQLDDVADPTATLATIPGASRYLLRLRELAGTRPPPGVELLAIDDETRSAAADLVRRHTGAAVVVVLRADEEASPELAAALAALSERNDAARFVTRRVHRFLGRAVQGEPEVVAWRGDALPDNPLALVDKVRGAA